MLLLLNFNFSSYSLPFFFLPFLLTLADQSLTTDSLSPGASHQSAQEPLLTRNQDLSPQRGPNRKIKIISLLQTMVSDGFGRGPRCVYAVHRIPSPPSPPLDLRMRRAFPLRTTINPEPWSALSGPLEIRILLSLI